MKLIYSACHPEPFDKLRTGSVKDLSVTSMRFFSRFALSE